MSSKITRREFLVTGAAATVGATLVACQPKTVIVEVEKEKVVKETVEVEKVVKETVEVEKVVKETVVVETVKEVQVTPEPTPSGYRESPMLAAKVKAGELPPLEERLPLEPLVLAIRTQLGEGIGRHGGTLTSLSHLADSEDRVMYSGGRVAMWDRVDKSYVPDIASWWKLSDDYKALTIRLRKGMKWSDGHPFTTDDVRFWWEDFILNEEVTPTVPDQYAPKGLAATLVIEDDFTFRFDYQEPYVGAVDSLEIAPWVPKHYLKNWHIKYNPDANKLAQEEGYSEWWEVLTAHNDTEYYQVDPDRPVLQPWIVYELDEVGTRRGERTPYYWKVDPEGNQLPYVDYHDNIKLTSGEIQIAKTIAGEYNFGGAYTVGLGSYPLVKENEEKGDYTVYLHKGDPWASSPSWCFNYTSDDEVLAEIFQDLRFRKAISYSLNREEFNQLFNLGLAVPRQGLPTPAWSFYEEGMDQYYIEYDVDLANQLLDEMGLEWDEKNEWRLRPDGERLSLLWEGLVRDMDQMEWIFAQWVPLGIHVDVKTVANELFQEHRAANLLDLVSWGSGGPQEVGSHGRYPIRLMPPWHWHGCCDMGGMDWRVWYESDGEEGKEPPQIIKDLFDVVAEWQAEPLGTDRYMELGREMIRINAENLWWFVVTGLAPGKMWGPGFSVAGNEVRNVRDPEPNQGWWLPELLWIDESLVPAHRKL